ncbi:MAG: hypothetical protein ACON5A_05455 [Candidatus Comchoanobacterales bacterium]
MPGFSTSLGFDVLLTIGATVFTCIHQSRLILSYSEAIPKLMNRFNITAVLVTNDGNFIFGKLNQNGGAYIDANELCCLVSNKDSLIHNYFEKVHLCDFDYREDIKLDDTILSNYYNIERCMLGCQISSYIIGTSMFNGSINNTSKNNDSKPWSSCTSIIRTT